MPLYRNNDRAILLVHIPKTGGSSLEEMLVDAGALQALKFHKRLGFSASTPQHMHWEVLNRWVPKQFYNFSLTIVRNPFDRIASEYAWRTHISAKPVAPFNTWLRDTLDAYPKTPFIYDNHIRPQVDFVGPKVRVFKLEDGLDPAAKMAFRRLGLTYRKPQTPHVRKSKHQIIEIEHSVLDRLRAFYADDFTAFGYDPDVVPAHLFQIVPDPAPEPDPAPQPGPTPAAEFIPPPPTPPLPAWRKKIRKIRRRLREWSKDGTQ